MLGGITSTPHINLHSNGSTPCCNDHAYKTSINLRKEKVNREVHNMFPAKDDSIALTSSTFVLRGSMTLYEKQLIPSNENTTPCELLKVGE